MKIKAGKILLSNPFLQDPNFARSVVVLCEYDKAGAIGFVLNNKYESNLNDLVELKTEIEFPVYIGGPVEPEKLFIIHQRNDIISESVHITDNIYWCGNFEEIVANINAGNLSPNDVQFYIGYSGWGAGQLDFEIDENSWVITNATNAIVFNTRSKSLWKDVLQSMGGDYKLMSGFPINPGLN